MTTLIQSDQLAQDLPPELNQPIPRDIALRPRVVSSLCCVLTLSMALVFPLGLVLPSVLFMKSLHLYMHGINAAAKVKNSNLVRMRSGAYCRALYTFTVPAGLVTRGSGPLPGTVDCPSQKGRTIQIIYDPSNPISNRPSQDLSSALVCIGIVVVIIGIGVPSLIMVDDFTTKTRRKRDIHLISIGNATCGEVIEASLIRERYSRCLRLVYRYQDSAGTYYQCSDKSSVSFDRRMSSRMIASQVGRKVAVVYDPAKPSRSTLYPPKWAISSGH